MSSEEMEQLEEEVIALLGQDKKAGVIDPESGDLTVSENTREKLFKLVGAKEKIIDAIVDEKERAIAQINFCLWQARLYRKAGYSWEAGDNYEIAEDQAQQEGLEDLRNMIAKETDEFAASVKNEQ